MRLIVSSGFSRGGGFSTTCRCYDCGHEDTIELPKVTLAGFMSSLDDRIAVREFIDKSESLPCARCLGNVVVL